MAVGVRDDARPEAAEQTADERAEAVVHEVAGKHPVPRSGGGGEAEHRDQHEHGSRADPRGQRRERDRQPEQARVGHQVDAARRVELGREERVVAVREDADGMRQHPLEKPLIRAVRPGRQRGRALPQAHRHRVRQDDEDRDRQEVDRVERHLRRLHVVAACAAGRGRRLHVVGRHLVGLDLGGIGVVRQAVRTGVVGEAGSRRRHTRMLPENRLFSGYEMAYIPDPNATGILRFEAEKVGQGGSECFVRFPTGHLDDHSRMPVPEVGDGVSAIDGVDDRPLVRRLHVFQQRRTCAGRVRRRSPSCRAPGRARGSSHEAAAASTWCSPPRTGSPRCLPAATAPARPSGSCRRRSARRPTR